MRAGELSTQHEGSLQCQVGACLKADPETTYFSLDTVSRCVPCQGLDVGTHACCASGQARMPLEGPLPLHPAPARGILS